MIMKKNILSYCLIGLLGYFFTACSANDSDVITPSGTGKGGSMARFAVAGDYLYVVDSRSLHVYELKDPTTPEKVKKVELGINIETIFPYRGNLFIGSQDGMHIYSIQDPTTPTHLSTYTHITSCDPVVVQDTLAFVTLRNGNACNRGLNQLEIIDISDPTNPILLTTYPMKNPFGLGIDGNTLFVGEGAFGLKVLKVENPFDISVIQTVNNLHAFDVIPSNNNLILTGQDGVFQYDYSQPGNLSLNSKLTSSNCQ